MTLGEKIYKLRTKRSMTQEQLAEKIGVSRQSVSKWETDSAIPDIEKLKLLAEIFEVSITELLGMKCEEDTKRKDEKRKNRTLPKRNKTVEEICYSFDSNFCGSSCCVYRWKYICKIFYY